MGQKVTIERLGRVAVVRLANPPRNYLGPLVRANLSAALTELEADPTVAGIVLSGSDGMFSAGYNPVRPDLRGGDVTLSQICLQIEDCPKPVVACLFGGAYGAGFELALAAHARVALAGTRVGLNDIASGYIPGAGGTQRLPRLLGAKTALSMMLSGGTVDVAEPKLSVLFDRIVQADVENAGIACLGRLLAAGGKPLKTRDRTDGFDDPLAYQEAIATCRKVLGKSPRLVQKSIVEAVESAQLLPFSAAATMEEALYEECARSDEAQGLLHMALAQRRTGNLPEAAEAGPIQVSTVGIVGSGPSARALVLAALEAGLGVCWFERDDEAVAAAKARLDQMFKSERIGPRRRAALLTLLQTTTDYKDLARAELVIEALADTPRTKRQVMAVLSGVMPASSVLVTHSATQGIDQIAEGTDRASQIVGLHFVPTRNRVRVAEYIPGGHSSATAVVTLHALLQRLNISPVRCGSQGGTIGARIMAACREAADYALDLGATPARVDAALVAFGKANGVFAVMDMVGLQTELERAAQLYQRRQYPLGHLGRAEALVLEGRKGRGQGGGYLLLLGRQHADPACQRCSEKRRARRPDDHASLPWGYGQRRRALATRGRGVASVRY